MNAEKIVEELRLLSENDEWVFAADITDEAADIIESLQAQLAKEKRRAEKAVEWKCFACKYEGGDCYGVSKCAAKGIRVGWQWRGDAEEGDAK